MRISFLKSLSLLFTADLNEMFLFVTKLFYDVRAKLFKEGKVATQKSAKT